MGSVNSGKPIFFFFRLELIAKNFLGEGIRMGSLRHGIDKEHIGVNIEMMHEFHWI